MVQESPDRLTIWFTEPLEPEFSEIRVLNAQGARVDNGDSFVDSNDPTVMSVTLPPLPDGTYTVAWSNLSTVDGHTLRGSFVFAVGEPISGQSQVETPDRPLLQSPAEPVMRWLVLLSILTVVGGLSFELLVWGPVLRASSGEAYPAARERLGSRMLRLTWLALGLFLVASVGQAAIQASVAYDLPVFQVFGSPLASVLTQTDWGHWWLWRIGLLVALSAVVGLLTFMRSEAHRQATVDAPAYRWTQALALAIGAGVLLTLSLTSHGAATTGITAAAVFSDYLHLLAAGFWVGGLFHFALGTPLLLGLLQGNERRAALAGMMPRFSTLATLSVGILIITGLYNAWAQVTILPAVVTPYGLTLVAKLAIIVPLLLLGALNLLWIRPRLSGNDRAGRWLRRFVAGEAMLAVLVLLSVGVLTALEPARQVASREGLGQDERVTFQDTVEGADITLEVEPGQVGLNRVVVDLKDRLGNPITNASDVRVGLVYLDADLGTETVSAIAMGNGRYVLEEALLSVAGAWQVELAVQRPDAFDARTAFRFEVVPGGAGGSAAIAPSPDTGKLLWGVELALLGILFLGVGLSLGGWWTRAGAGVMAPGVAGVLVGLVLVINSPFVTQQGGEPLRNPFPPNPESLEIGQQVYTQNCQSCHGDTGRGDGPAAAGLEPPPADLVVHVPLHPEHDLFRIIHDGIPGTAMAPLGDDLSDEEIWHVINYIKTFEE